MRVAVIGCGSIGLRHLRNLLELGCECTVIDPNLERRGLAREAGASVVIDPNAVMDPLSDRPDAMLVCTPWDRHLRYAHHAVHARIPLFVEKPLGGLDQIEAWRELVEASAGVVTQVGYQLRFHQRYLAMRGYIPSPTWASFVCLFDKRTWPGRGYGPDLLEASHELDLCLASVPGDLVDAQRTSKGVWLDFVGSIVTIEQDEEYLREWQLGNGPSFASEVFRSPDGLGTLMYRDELVHFLECVRSGRQTDVPLADGLRVLEVVQQVEQMTKVAA